MRALLACVFVSGLLVQKNEPFTNCEHTPNKPHKYQGNINYSNCDTVETKKYSFESYSTITENRKYHYGVIKK